MEIPLTVRNEQPKIGFFSRLTGLFASPGKVFSWLREKPDFLWPVIFILIYMGFTIPILNLQPQVMADKFPKYAEAMAQAPTNNGLVLIFAVVGALFGLVFAWGFTALIYWLLAKLVGKGETTGYPAALSMIGYTYVATALQYMFQGGLLLANGTMPPVGLEAGMDLGERLFSTTGVLYSQLNPFAIFGLILTCIALEKGFKLTRGKAVTIAILVWVVGIAFQVGSVSLSTRFLQ
jgi:hypothetical protein